jgi:outer membrane protein assembly factor BamA
VSLSLATVAAGVAAMRAIVLGACTSVALLAGLASPVLAQSSEPDTRQGIIETAAAEKATDLEPYQVTSAEKWVIKIERRFTGQVVRLHPFLEPAYSGGGFTVGSGYTFHPSPYSTLDVRGSYSIKSYKLAEAEFNYPRLFDRRANLNVRGGWRDATEVAFHGVGMDTPNEHLTWGFEQPYGSTSLTVRPTRGMLMGRGGVEWVKWDLKPGKGSGMSYDEVFSPETLAGVNTETTYLHSEATVGIDTRPSSGYARRGFFYGVTGHDFTDRDDTLGFRQVDYEAIQHIPLLRESWVLSLRGRLQTTFNKTDERVPFFMLPSLGSGSTLRGYSPFRFRDRNSMLMQAEWRVMANRFFESSVFYDTGKVTNRTQDIDFNGLKHDYGFGVRFHAPLMTVMRVDVARGSDGTRLVFAASPVF